VGQVGDGGVASPRTVEPHASDPVSQPRPAAAPSDNGADNGAGGATNLDAHRGLGGDNGAGGRERTAARVGALSVPAGSSAKRALDLAIAIGTAPIIVPVAFICALLITITSRGPVLFRQERVGLGGESFRMYKFRTMRRNAEAELSTDPMLWDKYIHNDYKVPVSDDPRVTRLGKWLRRTSLDELPQLINVLQGSMSIVGPRPVTRAQYDAFADVVDAYSSVRPGLTGYWQVNGRSDVHYPERAEYDRHYVAKWSIWLDISLIVRTPLAVLGGRGAH
jgi:lipopolysaccharide/colanic/teichoic acid biosynthesis glycosyltransferase